MNHYGKRILAYLLAFVLMFSFQLPAMAAGTASCLTITGSTYIDLDKAEGELQSIRLDQIFGDSSSHSISYQLISPIREHVSIANNPEYGGEYLSYTGNSEGNETVVIKGTCSNGSSQTVNLTIHSKPAEDGIEDQYNYNETDASQVTVWVTISSDGIPIVGNDTNSTVLCHKKVTVPYFDLESYGLEDYNRYETDESKSYTGDRIVRRPTALHLYIYLLERYYFGYPESECGKGGHDLSEIAEGEITNMFGQTAYDNAMSGLYITGSATSMYMQNFWGHDENLMYYRNHCYPLQRAGWGSTADYILLSDNDTIDLAMFTNWNFYTHGAFLCFGNGQTYRPVNDFNVTVGDTLTVQTLKFGTQSVANGGIDNFLPLTEDNSVFLVPEEGLNDLENMDIIPVGMVETGDDNEGSIWSYTFDTPGTYYLIGLDDNCGTDDACYAPATSKVVVTAPATELKITKQPVSYEGKVNDNAVFRVEAEGENLTYQWYYKSKTGTKYARCSAADAKTDTMTVKLASYRDGYTYYCAVADANGNTIDSEIVTMSIAAAPIEITKQPSDVEGNAGETVQFTVKANGTGLKYQWYYCKSGDTYSKCTSGGYNTDTLSVTVASYRIGYKYRCQVTDAKGNTVVSESAELKKGRTPLTITKQPVDYKGSVGSDATFTLTATGDVLTYQWYYSKNDGATFAKCTSAGYNTPSITLTMTSYRVGYKYYCKVTDGFGASIDSNTVSLTEQTAGITIQTQPQSVTASVGDTAYFTIKASGTNLTYQWQFSSDNGSTWSNSGMTGNKTVKLTVPVTAKRNGQMYRCVIKDSNGNKKISSKAKLTVQ